MLATCHSLVTTHYLLWLYYALVLADADRGYTHLLWLYLLWLDLLWLYYAPVLVDPERGVHARLRLLHLTKVLVEQAWRG